MKTMALGPVSPYLAPLVRHRSINGVLLPRQRLPSLQRRERLYKICHLHASRYQAWQMHPYRTQYLPWLMLLRLGARAGHHTLLASCRRNVTQKVASILPVLVTRPDTNLRVIASLSQTFPEIIELSAYFYQLIER